MCSGASTVIHTVTASAGTKSRGRKRVSFSIGAASTRMARPAGSRSAIRPRAQKSAGPAQRRGVPAVGQARCASGRPRSQHRPSAPTAASTPICRGVPTRLTHRRCSRAANRRRSRRCHRRLNRPLRRVKTQQERLRCCRVQGQRWCRAFRRPQPASLHVRKIRWCAPSLAMPRTRNGLRARAGTAAVLLHARVGGGQKPTRPK